MPKSDSLAKLEAIVNRQRLAAATPRERCLNLLALMAIRAYRKEQASSGEEATLVASSPVGASTVEAPASNSPRIGKFPNSRSDVARTGSYPLNDEQKTPDSSFIVHPSSLDLDPVTLPPETPVPESSASRLTDGSTRPGGRASEPKSKL